MRAKPAGQKSGHDALAVARKDIAHEGQRGGQQDHFKRDKRPEVIIDPQRDQTGHKRARDQVERMRGVSLAAGAGELSGA